MANPHIVILAAGKGTRMKSALPKVLHRACGLPLIDHVLRTAESLQPTTITVVVGHRAELLSQHLAGRSLVETVVQEPQLGTAHALQQSESRLLGQTGAPAARNVRGGAETGTVVLLSGDSPLLRPETLAGLVHTHQSTGAAATVLTATVEDPTGYGRIVRDNGLITAIIEQRDASAAIRAVREVNTGIYAFALEPLFDALREIGAGNAQGEFYLTDLVGLYRGRGLRVETASLADPDEGRGVNGRGELAAVAARMRDRKNAELMASGVTIIDPASTWVEVDVAIGPDTILHPGVYLQGGTRIGDACELQSNVRVVDSVIGDRVIINSFCVITESRVASGARIGPFAHLRPQSDVGEDAHIGNFVELKKTRLGRGSKANHLAYLGDAVIGEKVNIGAGTITCNYDGTSKHPTVIEDNVFIGSDSQLIAPVRIGKGAYVAAGSSITADVPADALAIARGTQVNKEGWVSRRKGARVTR